jgi:hypothetical protein
MTSTDVTRLYALLDELRREQRKDMNALQDEVVGYRADLNGRLKALEVAEARREGAGAARGGIGRIIVSVAAVAAAVGSVCGAVVALL